MQTPVAFFDIDGTLFRSSLLIELVDALIVHGLFPAAAATEYSAAYRAWQARDATYEAYIDDVVRCFLKHLVDVSEHEFKQIGEEVVSQKGDRVYRYTREYIQSLKQEGYKLIAISQSPKLILDEFCHNYGFDKVYGRMYDVDNNGNFTGEVMHEPIIANKANVYERVFARHPELTMEGSVAVGDTEGDIPLLEQVAKPICFNPNQLLFDHAKVNNWQVVVERKDVVYHL